MQQTPTASRPDTAAGRGTPLISVTDLEVHFPTDEGLVRAVDGVSFDIFPGRTLGVVGESGCGKSTVGRAILQILDRPGRIVNGSIELRLDPENEPDDAVDLASLGPNSGSMRAVRWADISLIFQEPMTSFSPVHTIGNQMLEAIQSHRGYGKKQAREWAIELLSMVGISNPQQRIDEFSHQLSGGIRQRAMIAMAISCEPKLLIADEPTTALDVTTQAQILDLLRELQESQGMAIMLITHDLGVIAEMADDVLVMYLGRGVEFGPSDDMFHNPKHPYTTSLLTSIPSIYTKRGERMQPIAGSIPHPFNRPPGCTFNPRCPSFMQGVCDQNPPLFLPLEGPHLVRCFLYHDAQGSPVASNGAAEAENDG